MNKDGANRLARKEFAAVLARAIRESRISLVDLRGQLAQRGCHVDPVTLEYWRSGSALPSEKRDKRTVAAIEVALGLGPGQLWGLVPDDAVSRWAKVRKASADDQIPKALEVLGLPGFDSFDNLFTEDSALQSESGQTMVEGSRHVLRATVDGLQSMPMITRVDPPTASMPEIRIGSGCELNEVVKLQGTDFICAELRFPRPLRRGELHALDFSVAWELDQPHEDYGFSRMVRPTTRYWAGVVHFEGPLPREVTYSYDSDGSSFDDGEPPLGQVQRIRPARRIQRVLRDPLPGLHAIQWRN